MTAVIWVLLAIAAGLIGVVLTVLLQDSIAAFLSRIVFLPFGGAGRNVSGTWYAYYTLVPDATSSVSAGRPVQRVEVINLRALGPRVVGHSARYQRQYVFQAVLRDGQFLTGTWRDFANEQNHWGGFQLCWHANGKRMTGKFVGKDSQNHVNHGLWVWTREEDALLAAAEWMAGAGGYGKAAEQMATELRRILGRADAAQVVTRTVEPAPERTQPPRPTEPIPDQPQQPAAGSERRPAEPAAGAGPQG